MPDDAKLPDKAPIPPLRKQVTLRGEIQRPVLRSDPAIRAYAEIPATQSGKDNSNVLIRSIQGHR
jgi:hypothetical protein